MSTGLITVAVGWLIVGILSVGIGTVVALGIHACVKGWQRVDTRREAKR